MVLMAEGTEVESQVKGRGGGARNWILQAAGWAKHRGWKQPIAAQASRAEAAEKEEGLRTPRRNRDQKDLGGWDQGGGAPRRRLIIGGAQMQ